MRIPSWKLRSLLSAALIVGRACAYGYDDDERPCDESCSVDTHSESARCTMQDDNQVLHYMSPMDGGYHRIPNGCTRSNIFGGDGYLVAYPSAGGVVFMKDPPAMTLQHLGLPHTRDTARVASEDDGLALRMVQLGAQWWPSWDLYFRHSSRIDSGIFYDFHYPSAVDVAVPSSGGFWVANFTQDRTRHQYEEKSCQPWLPHAPDLWRKKMRYALTMDDKAEMMKELGATFHKSVDEVDGLAKTVEEAVSLFEPFKKRLENMEDNEYRQRFCSGDSKQNEGDETVQQPEDVHSSRPRWGIASLFPDLRLQAWLGWPPVVAQ